VRDPWEDAGIQWLMKTMGWFFLGAVGSAVLAIVGIVKGVHWLAVVGVILEMPLSMLTANVGTVLVYQKREVQKQGGGDVSA